MKRQPVDINTFPLHGVSLIEASAGTGKTWTITHLYLRYLLETDYQVDRILVVTFTNAATDELKHRIQQLIYEVWNYLLSDQANDKLDPYFATFKGKPESIRQLQQALIRFDEAAIFSIHGFCQRILTRFPLHTGSRLQQQVINNDRELEQQAVRDLWRLRFYSMDSDQLQWVLGQWKTPDDCLQQIDLLKEFPTRIEDWKNQAKQQIECWDIKTAWAELKSLWINHRQEIFRVAVTSDSINRSKINRATTTRCIEELDSLFEQEIPWHLPEKWDNLTFEKLSDNIKKGQSETGVELPFFKHTRDFGERHAHWLQQQKRLLFVESAEYITAQVRQKKQQSQQLSFNDLIHLVSEQMNHNNQSLIRYIRKVYPIAMVDEFQDTDHHQYHIFNTLYPVSDSESLDYSLLMIGDPKQAIYSFRGADVFTYQQASAITPQQFTLQTNYRSTPEYVDLINALFDQPHNPFLLDTLIDYQPSKYAEKNRVEVTENGQPASPLVCWTLPYRDKPHTKEEANEYFSRCCALQIAELLQQQSLKVNGKALQAMDLTVLVRTAHQAGLIRNALSALGINSALQTRESVFRTRQAWEILLLLQVLIEPNDRGLLCGLLSTDLFCWNVQQIHQLQQDSQGLSDLLQGIQYYRELCQQQGFLAMFYRLLQQQQSLGILNHVEGERRLTNWLHIAELLQQQSMKQSSLTSLLHWLIQQRDDDSHDTPDSHQIRLESDRKLVRIVTIHKSKGLQFPVIFLPFAWNIKKLDGKPTCYTVHNELGERELKLLDDSQQSRWQREQEAEEVRLFYVAMTRAKYRCYIGWGHISGAGSSGLAHCLYPDQIEHKSHPNSLAISSQQQMLEPWKQMNQTHSRVSIVEQISQTITDQIQTDGPSTSIQALPFDRVIRQQWRSSSYSQMVSSQSHETIDRPDYDAVDQLVERRESEGNEFTRFNFEKGARAGSLLHDILEHQPFDQPVDKMLILQKCQDYGVDGEWAECLQNWMQDILDCTLKEFSLSDIPAKQTLVEMEFYLSCHQLSAASLSGWLTGLGYLLPGQHLEFQQIEGFLKGFIDLIIESDNRYYVIDYKSNYLGNQFTDYQRDHCHQAMLDHRYHLQYLIYTLALHRYLKTRLQEYDYDTHIGGVYYLFLRGMNSEPDNDYGVYFDRPSKAVIEQLDGLLS